MRKVKREYEVYSFAELSDGAKKNVLEKFRDINVEHDGWHDWILEEETERLESLGYKDARIYYSGFYSQGDGASFTCRLDVDTWLKSYKRISKYRKLKNLDISVKITTSGHYSHEYTMDVNSESDANSPKIDELLNELDEDILTEAREEARKIYKLLKDNYEDMQRDEEVIKTIESNEYEFLKNGKLFTD